MLTLQEFINKYTGVLCGDTPQNQGQCVGLIELWGDNLGLAHDWGDAKDLLNNADKGSYDVILNNPNNAPVAGDIIVWGSSWGNGYGHTGVVSSADVNTFTAFEQNNPAGHAPQLVHHANYTGVLGWLHPKLPTQQDGTFVDATTFQTLVSKSTHYDAFVKGGFNTIDDVQNRISSLQSTIDSLNKEVGDDKNKINDLESELAKVNQQASSIASDLAKVKSDDSNLGTRNLDLAHEVDDKTKDLESLYSALSVADQTSALTKIDDLLKPHEDVVKEVQPLVEGLAQAAIAVKKPVQVSTRNPIKLFWNWLNS